uniref:Uncharacterized protein n=1 Tax=Micrurus carvalhoi TaxID=3147026 RepID=A0A2H6N946_9SAUR
MDDGSFPQHYISWSTVKEKHGNETILYRGISYILKVMIMDLSQFRPLHNGGCTDLRSVMFPVIPSFQGLGNQASHLLVQPFASKKRLQSYFHHSVFSGAAGM